MEDANSHRGKVIFLLQSRPDNELWWSVCSGDDDDDDDELQVYVVRTQVRECTVIGWCKSLTDL